VEGILKEPKPYVQITNFYNFSVEYTLYVFIKQIKRLSIIESDLKRTVLEVCGKNEIDLTTPNLIYNINGKKPKTSNEN
jgi:small-conductance mechanosensitive channel